MHRVVGLAALGRHDSAHRRWFARIVRHFPRPVFPLCRPFHRADFSPVLAGSAIEQRSSPTKEPLLQTENSPGEGGEGEGRSDDFWTLGSLLERGKKEYRDFVDVEDVGIL